MAGNIVSSQDAPYFKFFPQKLNWFDARSVCVSFGGDLASFHSAEENAAAAAILPEDSSYNYVWIGMQDTITQGEWFWVDGTPMDYHNHEDSNVRAGAECGEFHNANLGRLGMWDDNDCQNTLQPFICRL